MNRNERGFTVVELMIATTVFATVLLLITAGMIHIGKLYYKGVTTVRTQELARSIAEDIAGQIKFANYDEVTHLPNASPARFCIGGVHYFYQTDNRFDSTTDTGLKKETTTASCATNPTSSATQLLSTGMYLIDLEICPSGGDLCDINVTIGFGPDDNVFVDSNPNTKECRGVVTGSQFCGVVNIRSTVLKRVN